jgi:hypothetical protein
VQVELPACAHFQAYGGFIMHCEIILLTVTQHGFFPTVNDYALPYHPDHVNRYDSVTAKVVASRKQKVWHSRGRRDCLQDASYINICMKQAVMLWAGIFWYMSSGFKLQLCRPCCACSFIILLE